MINHVNDNYASVVAECLEMLGEGDTHVHVTRHGFTATKNRDAQGASEQHGPLILHLDDEGELVGFEFLE